MMTELSLEVLLTAAAQIILPMAGMQILYRLADRKGRLARRLLPTAARRGVLLTVGVILTVLIVGAAAFLLRTGIGVYFMICGAAVGLMTGIALASLSGGEDE